MDAYLGTFESDLQLTEALVAFVGGCAGDRAPALFLAFFVVHLRKHVHSREGGLEFLLHAPGDITQTTHAQSRKQRYVTQ